MKFKKTKKMALVLSLSLGLTVPVWAADPVEIKSIDDKSLETGPDVSAFAKGLTSQGEYFDGTSFKITVEALAGMNAFESADAEAEAYGILNSGLITTGDNAITVAATGGAAESNSDSATASAEAYGIKNHHTLSTENNTIVVTAIGGEAEYTGNGYGYADAYAGVVGIANLDTMTTGANTITMTATGGTAKSSSDDVSVSAFVSAYGIISYSMTTGANTITMTATGGTAKSSSGSANANVEYYGIFNIVTMTTEANMITVTATGGVAESSLDYSEASAEIYGIENSGTMSTKTNTITVTATGGTADISSVFASGIENHGTLTTEPNTITVTASGGIAESNSGDADANAVASGIKNHGGLITGENVIKVIAMGGIVKGSSGYAETVAVGMYSGNTGILTAVGKQNIYTEAVAGTVNGVPEKAYAYALMAYNGGTIILDSQGEAVQLTGDIGAMGTGAITVSLDNSDSYWRPRFQDTYYDAENGSFGGGSFTMKNGGVLDLAWHSNLGGYNFKDSQLNLTGDTIQIGDGATFIVNADLANDAADTITTSTTATGTQYVQVAYDPSYLTYETVEGRALVLEFGGANGQGVASTIETPIRNVTLMPTMDGGYLIRLTFTSEASEGGKTASDSYQQQINILRTQWSTLVQRLGDVRNENPDSHNGSWARTYGGKLKSDGAYGRKSTMKYGGVQAGYDRMRETGSGKYLVGFLLDYMDADSDFQRGSGNTESLAFGGYWTWLSPKGHYADVVVKATHLDTDYDFYYLSGEKASADLTNWGYTMSMEYGYRYYLRKNRYIEPQAQFIVGRLEGKNYRTSNGVNLHQDGVNLAMGRLGVLFGWTDENKSSAYVRGSIVHDFSGSGTLTSSYGGDRMRIDTAGNSGTSFEVNLGANVTLGKNSHLYAELTKSFGGDVKTDWQANVGWRVKW